MSNESNHNEGGNVAANCWESKKTPSPPPLSTATKRADKQTNEKKDFCTHPGDYDAYHKSSNKRPGRLFQS